MGDAPPLPPPAQRPSGLRPPTNIGRIARPSGLPKPPTPLTPYPPTPTTPAAQTPRPSGVAPQRQQEQARIRKINEEVSRMKLADVEEEEYEGPPSTYDLMRRDSEVSRRSSIGSGSRRGSEDYRRKRPSDALPSAEALWENARRLSEAGVRRCSDTSIVLTEDTDSFIIGDKVWVGGTKPGQIAYIGETQFAPGEWAGVVLDETIGKNDGSVAGVRYFQCEAKRGVFSRLTRLTRVPLVTADGDGGEPTSPLSRRPSSALSLTGSLRGESKKSPSPTPLDVSTNSIGPHSPTTPDLRIGERVIVMSSQGSKAGVLRYIGSTEFAAGTWAGVELDDPLGKNDGSVGNKRYFECMPKYGLFAPVAKVSRSPSSGAGMRRGVCSVHHGSITSGSTSNLRRRGSRESIASTAGSTSSALRSPAPRVRLGVNSLGQKPSTRTTPTAATAHTTLQNTLRDKEQYIEQLLKERELERAEVTRAASQVDDAEQKLSNLKVEFEQYQEQMDAQMQDMQLMVSRLEVDKSELSTQLEEERRRMEDLQFRFEEATIVKTDMEKRKQEQQTQDAVYLERIKELEKALQDERRRAEELELESNRAFEEEENLAKAREEAEQELNSKLEELRLQITTKESALTEKEEALKTQEKEISSLRVEIEGLKNKTFAQGEVEKSSSTELQRLKQDNDQLQQRISTAEGRLDQAMKEKQALEGKISELQAANSNSVKNESDAAERLAREVARISELEGQLKLMAEEQKRVVDKYSSLLSENKKDIEELRKAKDEEVSQVKQELQKQAEETLKLKDMELEKMGQTYSKLKQDSCKEMDELKHQKDAEIEGLKQSLMKHGDEALKAKQEELDKMTQLYSNLKDEVKKEMEEFKNQKDAEIENLRQSLTKMRDDALKAKQEELDKLTQLYSCLKEDSKKELVELRDRKDLEMEELRQSLRKNSDEVLQSKQKEINDMTQLYSTLKNESHEEIEKLRKEKESELETLKQSLTNQSDSLKMKHEELEKVIAEFSSYKTQITKELELLRHEKDSEIESLKQTLLKQGNEALNAKQQELETVKETLSSLQMERKTELEEIKKSHAVEMDALKKYSQSKEDEATELRSQVQLLQLNVESQTAERKESVSVIENKMAEVNLQRDNLLKENERLVPILSQLEIEVTSLKEETMKKDEALVEMQSWLETMTSQMCQLLSVMGGSLPDYVPSTNGMVSTPNKQSEPSDVSAKLKTVGSMLQSCAELGVKMKGVIVELEETKKRESEMVKSFQMEKESLEEMAHSLKSVLEKQEKDIQDRQNEINQLKADKSQASKYKSLMEGLEREKTQLERKVVELQVAVAQSKANANNEDTTYQKLMEEKEMAQGQIDFLNSVIVDMQRKNDDLKARVEILEIGITPADADELNLNGIKPRMVAPRLFCDICDMFDLHDTEDCPRQASDSSPPPLLRHRAVTPEGGKSKRVVQERPYCEHCELFGHDTADCEDGETF